MSLDSISPLQFAAGGKNIRLRLLVRSDRDEMIRFANHNYGVINGPFPVTTEALTKGHRAAEKWIAEKTANIHEDKGLIMVIEDMANRAIIGYVSAFMFEWRVPRCEMAWMVDAAYQRKGIAGICCKYLLDFLCEETGLQKVVSRIDPKNISSVKLAEKLGFRLEGVHHRDFRDGYGRLLDVSYYAYLP